ncbi:50S ribosomal protein L11 methyltransferase [Brevundimonas sp. S30B]|uniref:50S ribosomal protein L11 methyltransferase n=1 Tax=unclassified Brevundimonas TaxID=2622653 RepID=UPI001071D64D|nr:MULTISPECIES: 50S ribosomal protein L11 methyltransferase [unclassified Brevundimonas]QBX37654.1 50S ribosomal protein L11 methyltransferase [Brevundimonas sp. MF30-B]TFW03553.1 50S ribosomal protein L11 methyltransferase [Brevundimonas sp. S30B]
MSESAVQITARGPRDAAEAAAAAVDADIALEGATYSILEEDEDKGVWRIDGFPTSDEEARLMEAVLRGYEDLEVVVEKLADADWLAMSLSGLPPVEAGRFFVYGAHDQGKVPEGRVNLKIDAGAAFGTGHHGTTVGCLEAFDRLLQTECFDKVLDVGCGTGVLAIAAAKTGSPIAVGTDIDEPSARIANENAEINDAKCDFYFADGLSDPRIAQHAPYDLVFANILAAPLVELAPEIAGALKSGGVAILSGLLRTQEERVLDAYRPLGFIVEQTIHHDAWSALALRKAGQEG